MTPIMEGNRSLFSARTKVTSVPSIRTGRSIPGMGVGVGGGVEVGVGVDVNVGVGFRKGRMPDAPFCPPNTRRPPASASTPQRIRATNPTISRGRNLAGWWRAGIAGAGISRAGADGRTPWKGITTVFPGPVATTSRTVWPKRTRSFGLRVVGPVMSCSLTQVPLVLPSSRISSLSSQSQTVAWMRETLASGKMMSLGDSRPIRIPWGKLDTSLRYGCPEGCIAVTYFLLSQRPPEPIRQPPPGCRAQSGSYWRYRPE